jgi:hypothetical protein
VESSNKPEPAGSNVGHATKEKMNLMDAID